MWPLTLLKDVSWILFAICISSHTSKVQSNSKNYIMHWNYFRGATWWCYCSVPEPLRYHCREMFLWLGHRSCVNSEPGCFLAALIMLLLVLGHICANKTYFLLETWCIFYYPPPTHTHQYFYHCLTTFTTSADKVRIHEMTFKWLHSSIFISKSFFFCTQLSWKKKRSGIFKNILFIFKLKYTSTLLPKTLLWKNHIVLYVQIKQSNSFNF